MKKAIKYIAVWALTVSMLVSLCACGRFRSDKHFSYVTTDMKKYASLSLSDFTGKSLALAGEYTFTTDEEAAKKLRYYQIYYSEFTTESDINGNSVLKRFYAGKPDFSDAAYIYYELATTETGECIASNLYGNSLPIDIGYYEFPEGWRSSTPDFFYLKEVSDAVSNQEPVSRRFDGIVAKGEVVRISFTSQWADGTTGPKAVHLRYDTVHHIPDGSSTNTAVEGLADALIGKQVGDIFTHTVTGSRGGTEMDITYTVTVNWVAEESLVTVPITVPEDFFKQQEGETWFSLNGKTVYLRFFVEDYLNAQVPALNLDFYQRIIKNFKSETTNSEALYAEAIEAMKAQLDEEAYKAIKQELLFTLLESLQDKVKHIPIEEYNSYYDDICAVEREDYGAARAEAESAGIAFPYANIDEYIVYVTNNQYSSLHDFAAEYAEGQIATRILLFAIAQEVGLRMTEEENEKLYQDNLAFAAEHNGISKEEYVELFADQGGEAYLRWMVSYSYHLDEVTKYIFENNTYTLPQK